MLDPKIIERAARAYDAWGLEKQGWSKDEIEHAMSITPVSPVGMATARVILEAAQPQH